MLGYAMFISVEGIIRFKIAVEGIFLTLGKVNPR